MPSQWRQVEDSMTNAVASLEASARRVLPRLDLEGSSEPGEEAGTSAVPDAGNLSTTAGPHP